MPVRSRKASLPSPSQHLGERHRKFFLRHLQEQDLAECSAPKTHESAQEPLVGCKILHIRGHLPCRLKGSKINSISRKSPRGAALARISSTLRKIDGFFHCLPLRSARCGGRCIGMHLEKPSSNGRKI